MAITEILKYEGGELHLTLPDTLDGRPVTSIGEEAFYNYRYSLREIKIPASVTHIGSGAFSMTDLTEIEIPAGVVSMGDNPFSYCISLKTITVKTGKMNADHLGDGAFKGIHKKATFKCPDAKRKAYKKLFVKAGAPKTCKFK